MAWGYLMAIRCPDEWVAHALADKYAGQTFTFADAQGMGGGDVCKFGVVARAAAGEWWVDVWARGVTSTGISGAEEASRANQFCNVMYGMLRNERFFDYALAAVECAEFRTLEDLTRDLDSGGARVFDGLVVSDRILAERGSPDYFVEFSESHRWIPKQPERYTPPHDAGSPEG